MRTTAAAGTGALVLALVLAASPASAQTASSDEAAVRLFVGYAFNSVDGGNLNGARLSPEFSARPWLKIVADGSWEKGSPNSNPITLVTFLGGPRLTRNVGSGRLFVHALAGGVRESSSLRIFGVSIAQVAGVDSAETKFGLDAGAGYDFKFGESMRARVGADFLSRKGPTGDRISDIRATVGVVF